MELRPYGLLFAAGLLLAAYVINKLFKKKELPQAAFDSLTIYIFIGMFLGARLFHCFFYEWFYYKDHLLEIMLPVTIHANGVWEFVGYQGFASHGGAFGIIIAAILGCRKLKVPFLQVADIIAIVIPLTGGFIRIGNFFNGEIVGTASSLPWATVFPEVDYIPRHPAQIYEAIVYFAIYAAIYFLYRRRDNGAISVKDGFFVGLSMFAIALFRFFIEFIKMPQPGEVEAVINMGQVLSIPYVIVGLLIMFWKRGS